MDVTKKLLKEIHQSKKEIERLKSMEWDGNERRSESAQDKIDHIELAWIKKILVGSILALVTHFAAGIWWAATITANMNYIRQDIVRLSDEIKAGSADRYRGADATKDLSIVYERFNRNESRITRLEDNLRAKI